MKKPVKNIKIDPHQSEHSSVSEQRVPQKLILKKLLLDHPRKGQLISIRAWRCTSLTVDTNKISDEVETFATGKKYSGKEKSILWSRLERCLPKSNKYFKKIEIVHYHRKDIRRRFWHGIYKRHPVKEIRKWDVEDIPDRCFLRQNITMLDVPITPNVAQTIGRLHKLSTFQSQFTFIRKRPDLFQKAQRNIERILRSLQRFVWLCDIPAQVIKQHIFHLRKLVLTSDDDQNLVEAFNSACRSKYFKNLESLHIQFNHQNAELDISFLNYLDLKHFGYGGFQTQGKHLDALKSQDRLTSLSLELKEPEFKQLIISMQALKYLQEIKIETNATFVLPGESAQIFNGLKHLQYASFNINSNKKNAYFYENLKLNIQNLHLRIFLSKKEELCELEACGKFLNNSIGLQKLSVQVTQVIPGTLKILKVALPKLVKLKDLKLDFNGHNKLSDNDYPSFTEICSILEHIDYCELIIMGKAIVNKEIKGMFDNFAKIRQMKVFKFTANFISVDERGLQEVINFVKTRERNQFREVYISPDGYKKSTFELMRALYRFQGLSIN